MGKNEQIDKLSKKYVKLSPSKIAFAKRAHRRYLRRIAKDINNSIIDIQVGLDK